MHGLFANDGLRRAWLTALGWRGPQGAAAPPALHTALERLANQVEANLDMAKLESIVWGS
jgi:cobyric acid synthase